MINVNSDGVKTFHGSRPKFVPNRDCALEKFDGSKEFFNFCWRVFCKWVNEHKPLPILGCQDDVDEWLDEIAAEQVNDPKSRFYIHG